MAAVSVSNVHPLVESELQELYRRCQEAGASREQVDAVLASKFDPEEKSHVEIPERELVEQAWQLMQAGNQLEAEELAKRWLLVAHRAREGDVVHVSGWSRPREILIDKVQFIWSKQAKVEDGWLRLDGPTIFIGGIGVRHNVTSLAAVITRQTYPSARMRARYPDRFRGQFARFG